MNSTVAVSVIVPTRNRAHYLNDCLRSLAAQDYDQFEVVVVDNGSTDNTAEILEEWLRKDARFRTTCEGQVGLSRAKNAGVGLAGGDLLLFTDDDVIVDCGWIDSYVRFFSSAEDELRIVGGKIVPIPDDLSDWPDWVTDPMLGDLGRLDYEDERPLHQAWEYVWGANMAFQACAVERFGSWNNALGRRGDERGTFEDTEFQDRARAAGATVWFCPGAVVRHRIARGGVTPCRVLMTSFTRGRNGYWQEKARLTGEHRPDQSPKVTGFLAFIRYFTSWFLWTALFRLTSAKWMFHRSHSAAWSAGWTIERLRDGRTSPLAAKAIGRLGFLIRRAALGLAPGSVAGAEETLGLRSIPSVRSRFRRRHTQT
jgi:GT2 family glycosyltransferase